MQRRCKASCRITSKTAQRFTQTKLWPTRGLPDHEAVKHAIGEFVNEMANTNGIESFRCHCKRGFHGTFHPMSVEHPHRDVDEFATRHNGQNQDTIDMVMNTVAGMIGKRLMSREVIA